MLTLAVRDERPGFRPYEAVVARVTSLTPHFTRVTFTGPHFATFGTDGLDQRIKILFPVPGLGLSDLGVNDPDALAVGSWYTRWRDLPTETRSPLRTYTVRAVRPQVAELDVDFVSHGDGGPAAQWLQTAAQGDEVIIVGPDAMSVDSALGIDWHPGTARDVLLVGDETATPAICSILESLPAGMRARAFIQVPSAADILPITSEADITLSWFPLDEPGPGIEAAVRDWAVGHPQLLEHVLAHNRQELDDIDVDVELLWESPAAGTGDFYAWLAGESSLIKSLRRFLVSEVGMDRKRVAFTGYWRLGKSEAQE